MNKGIKFYETAIHKFLGNSVIKRLEEIHFKNDEEVRQRLLPDTSIGQGEWVDISGLIAPKTEIERLMSDIEMTVLQKCMPIIIPMNGLGRMEKCWSSTDWMPKQ